MHFVVLGEHTAHLCPTANATTRELLLKVAPEIPALAEKHGVTIVAGPYVNREHLTVVVVETERAEDLDRFLVESRLAQWNTLRILPSLSMQAGIEELNQLPALY